MLVSLRVTCFYLKWNKSNAAVTLLRNTFSFFPFSSSFFFSFFFPQNWAILPSYTQLNAQIKFFMKYFRVQNIQSIFKIIWWRDLTCPASDCWVLERPDLLQIYRRFYLKLLRFERSRIYIDAQISVFLQFNWKLTFNPRDFIKNFFGIQKYV